MKALWYYKRCPMLTAPSQNMPHKWKGGFWAPKQKLEGTHKIYPRNFVRALNWCKWLNPCIAYLFGSFQSLHGYGVLLCVFYFNSGKKMFNKIRLYISDLFILLTFSCIDWLQERLKRYSVVNMDAIRWTYCIHTDTI
jgi:hypothetical protein